MLLGDMDYQELNARVEITLKKRKMLVRYVLFGTSIFMFIVFSVLAWVMVSGSTAAAELSNTGADDPILGAMILFIVGWLTTLFFDGLGLVIDTGIGDKQMRSQILTEQLGQNLMEMVQASAEKPKRDADGLDADAQAMEISDDGELIPVEKRQQS